MTGANTNDSLMFETLLDDIPAVGTPAGRGRRPTEACMVTLIPRVPAFSRYGIYVRIVVDDPAAP